MFQEISSGVVGEGMPVAMQIDARVRARSRRDTAASPEVGVTRFEELPLSGVLKQESWEELLPTKDVFSKYLKELLRNPAYGNNKKLYLYYCLGSVFFFLAATCVYIRFFWAEGDSTLRQKEFTAESIRVFGGGLAYVASLTTTLSSAYYNLKTLFALNKSIKKKQESLINEYDDFRKKVIYEYNIKVIFFSLAEVVYELTIFPVGCVVHYEKYAELCASAKELLKNVKSEVDVPSLYLHGDLRYIVFANRLAIIRDLKKVLLGPRFKKITDEIIKFIIEGVLKLKFYAVNREKSIKFKDDFIEKVKKDFDTQCFVLDAIGEIAILRRQTQRSHLFTSTKKITEERAHPSILEALREYWADPETATHGDYPSDIVIKDLSEFILITLKEKHWSSMFEPSFSVPIAMPSPLCSMGCLMP